MRPDRGLTYSDVWHVVSRLCAQLSPVFAAVMVPILVAAAQPPQRSLSDYKRAFWSSEDGAPGDILAITQTTQGYLILGSADGLYRFDGVAFARVPPPRDGALRSDQVNALMTAENGDVWVGYHFGGVAVYRDGRLKDMTGGPPSGSVQQIVETRDHSIWVAAQGKKRANLRRYQGGAWRSATDFGLPVDSIVHRLIGARDGSLWVATDRSVLVLRPGAHRFEATDTAVSLHFTEEKTGFAEDRQGRIWLSDQAGLRQVMPPGRHTAKTGETLGEVQPGHTLLIDSENALWDAGVANIFRISQPDAPASVRDAVADRIATSDNEKTGPNALTIYEDREKNIWIGTLFGLVSFRPTSFRSDPGLRADARFQNLLKRDKSGAIYSVSADGIFQIDGDRAARRLATLGIVPMNACADPRGGLYVSSENRILHYQGGRLREIPIPSDWQNVVSGPCLADDQGRLWVSVAHVGVMRWDGSAWSRVPVLPDDPTHFPMNMIGSQDGSVLLNYAANYIAKVNGERRAIYKLDDAVSPGPMTFIFEQGGDIFAGGDKGLVRVHAGKVQLLPATRFSYLRGLGGMTSTPDGSTWLFGSMGMARVSTRTLLASFDDPAVMVPARVFGPGAGLVGKPQKFIDNSVISDANGNVWISTTFGVSRISNSTIFDNRIEPPVAIQALVVDKRSYATKSEVTLPAGSRDIRIDYTGLSLSDPKAMRFLYRIEGVDRDWVEAGPRRQAFYSNLRPGTYRFQVVAANNDGVWNRTGASMLLTIPPTFRQTWWFVALCVGIGATLLWMIYALRLRQATQRVRQIEQTRLAERERIARDLHDTLLQSLQGLILRFQSITTRIPADLSARTDMEAALQRADAVVVEGRDSVLDLRSTSIEPDFEILIGGAIAKIAVSQRISLNSEGWPRRVNPAISDELSHIVSEAVRNAARHSNGSAIDVLIAFGVKALSVTVSDDGIGIDDTIIAEGRQGHYGLTGMRERAARIKASFILTRGAKRGTVAEISVPARFAYTDRTWWQRILSVG